MNVAFFLNHSFVRIHVNNVSHYNIAYSQSAICKMSAYFNLNNNVVSKGLLVNKFKMTLDSLGGLVLNYQSITSPNSDAQRSPGFDQKQHPPEVFRKKRVLKNFANFTRKHLRWSLFVI